MKVYVLEFAIHFPYEGDTHDVRGVYSTRAKARAAAQAEIRKDWPNAKRNGRKDDWDLVPGAYDDHSLTVYAMELDA